MFEFSPYFVVWKWTRIFFILFYVLFTPLFMIFYFLLKWIHVDHVTIVISGQNFKKKLNFKHFNQSSFRIKKNTKIKESLEHLPMDGWNCRGKKRFRKMRKSAYFGNDILFIQSDTRNKRTNIFSNIISVIYQFYEYFKY